MSQVIPISTIPERCMCGCYRFWEAPGNRWLCCQCKPSPTDAASRPLGYVPPDTRQGRITAEELGRAGRLARGERD